MSSTPLRPILFVITGIVTFFSLTAYAISTSSPGTCTTDHSSHAAHPEHTKDIHYQGSLQHASPETLAAINTFYSNKTLLSITTPDNGHTLILKFTDNTQLKLQANKGIRVVN